MTMHEQHVRKSLPALDRYDYEYAETFADLKRMAGEGWRLAGVAAVVRSPGIAETVYVVERPAGRVR